MTAAAGVDPALVGRALRAHLADAGTSLRLHDRATGEVLDAPPDLAGDPAGLLPVFLVAGEAVWREATGKGFGLRIRRDPDALLGYRAEGIGAGTFCAVALSTMEAVAQARGGNAGVLLVNGLIASSWQAVLEGTESGVSAPEPPGADPAVPAAPCPPETGACP